MNTLNLSQKPRVAVPSLPPSHTFLNTVLHRVKTILTYAVFELLRSFSVLPQDSIRVFEASSKEDFSEQLRRQNTNLTTNSVTATQFLYFRNLAVIERAQSAPAQLTSTQADQQGESVAVWAKDLWDKHMAMRKAQLARQTVTVATSSSLPESSNTTGVPASLDMCLLDTKHLELERGKGGDYDTPYRFTLPVSVKEQLVWAHLQARVNAGEVRS